MIGCGPGLPAKLETINLSVEQIDMWIPLYFDLGQVGGLWEVASRVKDKKPFLVAPEKLLAPIKSLFLALGDGVPLNNFFDVRGASKAIINEEHHTENLRFVPNYGTRPSYGLSLEESEIFISGRTAINDEFLHQHGSPAEVILHSCEHPEATLDMLSALPVYIQKKTWLYGYSSPIEKMDEPLPMLFLPQGTCVYDSSRKDKHLEKERFIRENSKRVLGNQSSS